MSGFTQSQANDASFDGSVVVGTLATAPNGVTQAFRWTQAGGMQGLGGGTRANAISGNGNVIVGTRADSPISMIWTAAGGVQTLTPLGGSGNSEARAVNFDGSIIVGRSGIVLLTTMWVNGSPIELQSTIANSRFTPFGLSDDGSIVAGQVQGPGGSLFAGVWTQATGTMSLSDYLTANGVALPAGVTLGNCTAVSADGRTFGGVAGIPSGGGQGFVATVPAPCPADLDNDGNFANGGTRDHAVTIDDLLYFLAGFEAGSTAADLDNGTGTGTRDGAVTVEDLLFFLVHFEAGC